MMILDMINNYGIIGTKMIKVGITGQQGFIGNHLMNTLNLLPEEFELVNFEKKYFNDQNKLDSFVSNCDVIVHLAAMNRHEDPQIIYDANMGLVTQLVASLTVTNSKAHVIFSSSSQEEKENLYGQSKKHGRELFTRWSADSSGRFSGLVIPNVFGPFGIPDYNSFIATFCYKLNNNHLPRVDVDGEVKLIYVADLVKEIISEIRSPSAAEYRIINPTDHKKVSEILELLQNYKSKYLDKGEIPELKNQFEINLFNTFRSYSNLKDVFPRKFTVHADQRGKFVEIIRLNVGGQVSFSTTLPGVTRGNHFHTRKIERFAVISGKALIQLRRIGGDETLNFYLDGDEPSYVDMPVWYTHNIQNIGDNDLYTNFWINEFYDAADPDTYFENV